MARMKSAEVVARPYGKGRSTEAQRMQAVKAWRGEVDRDARREAREAVREHARAFNPIKGLLEALAEGRV